VCVGPGWLCTERAREEIRHAEKTLQLAFKRALAVCTAALELASVYFYCCRLLCKWCVCVR